MSLEEVRERVENAPRLSTEGWQVKKVRAKIRKGGKQREFIWEVTCPFEVPEPTWENDFGRGMLCGCRRFPTEGKATRYVERMTACKGKNIDYEGE